MTELTCLKSWEVDMVVDGYIAAMKGEPFSVMAPDHWRSGFRQYLINTGKPLPPGAELDGKPH